MSACLIWAHSSFEFYDHGRCEWLRACPNVLMFWSDAMVPVSHGSVMSPVHNTSHTSQTSHSASRGITPLPWELRDQWSIIRELMVAAEILAAHGLCNPISYLAASLHISHCRAEEAVSEGNIAARAGEQYLMNYPLSCPVHLLCYATLPPSYYTDWIFIGNANYLAPLSPHVTSFS